jgi:hypothetical protein
MVRPTLGQQLSIGLFTKKRRNQQVKIILQTIRSFYDKETSKVLYGKNHSLLGGILCHQKPSFFSFTRNRTEKVSQYLVLIDDAEQIIRDNLRILSSKEISLTRVDRQALEEMRNSLLVEWGINQDELLDSQAGRELSAVIEELIEELTKFLMPSKEELSVSLTAPR